VNFRKKRGLFEKGKNHPVLSPLWRKAPNFPKGLNTFFGEKNVFARKQKGELFKSIKVKGGRV